MRAASSPAVQHVALATRREHTQRRPEAVAGQHASALALAAVLLTASPAGAELNRFEANTLGEFNRGSAQQFGGTNQVCAAATVWQLFLSLVFPLSTHASAAPTFCPRPPASPLPEHRRRWTL
jgi:hypothetical protein